MACERGVSNWSNLWVFLAAASGREANAVLLVHRYVQLVLPKGHPEYI